ncbi:MAG: 4Fe-4S dicluster domain-containing protein [Candidatus Micrarchaeota archaeon]|nr:4Fe-4S dicluster domain-containing protein [Candidatus Micrarchaeota archaeon]
MADGGMDVFVDKPKCTGCRHCFDVCPVAVFEMHPKDGGNVNADTAPADKQWKGTDDPAVVAKFKDMPDGHTHFTEKSVAVNGSACILCQACLIECEGECIHITDTSGQKYISIYK